MTYTLNVGMRALLPVALAGFVCGIAFNFILSIGMLFTESVYFIVIGAVFIVYLFGILFTKTDVIKKMKWAFRAHASILRFVNIFPDRSKNGETENDMPEVLFYETPTHRIRGKIKNIVQEQDGWWCVIHFQSPPVPETGYRQEEFRLDDPRIELSGRSGADYALYIITGGRSLVSNPNYQRGEKSLSILKTKEI